jgi:hypothetical protein
MFDTLYRVRHVEAWTVGVQTNLTPSSTMFPPNQAHPPINPFTHYNYQPSTSNHTPSNSQLQQNQVQHGRQPTLSPVFTQSNEENTDPFLQPPVSGSHPAQGSSRPTLNHPFLMGTPGPSTNPYESPAASYFADTPSPYTSEVS